MANIEKHTPYTPKASELDTAVAVLEKEEPQTIYDLEKALKNARKEGGAEIPSDAETETPEETELSPEKAGFLEKMKSIASRFGETLKSAFNFMVVKPAVWLKEKIKEHPILTTVIIIGVILTWYFSSPVAFGVSAMSAEGAVIIEEVFQKSLEIDPGQVSDYLCTG